MLTVSSAIARISPSIGFIVATIFALPCSASAGSELLKKNVTMSIAFANEVLYGD